MSIFIFIDLFYKFDESKTKWGALFRLKFNPDANGFFPGFLTQ